MLMRVHIVFKLKILLFSLSTLDQCFILDVHSDYMMENGCVRFFCFTVCQYLFSLLAGCSVVLRPRGLRGHNRLDGSFVQYRAQKQLSLGQAVTAQA